MRIPDFHRNPSNSCFFFVCSSLSHISLKMTNVLRLPGTKLSPNPSINCQVIFEIAPTPRAIMILFYTEQRRDTLGQSPDVSQHACLVHVAAKNNHCHHFDRFIFIFFSECEKQK